MAVNTPRPITSALIAVGGGGRAESAGYSSRVARVGVVFIVYIVASTPFNVAVDVVNWDEIVETRT